MTIHKYMDKGFKLLSKKFLQELVNKTGTKAQVVGLLNCNLLNEKNHELITDCTVLLDDNTILIIEFQNSPITRKIAKRFAEYAILTSKDYNKDCRVAIFYTANVKVEKTCFKVLETIFIQTTIVQFDEMTGEELLNKIKLKLKNNEEITQEDLLDLSTATLYETENIDKLALDSIELLESIKKISKEDCNYITNAILLISDGIITNEETKRKIRSKIKMRNSMVQAEREEGIKEGHREGLKKGKIEVARNLITDVGLSLEKTSEIVNIPIDELKTLL